MPETIDMAAMRGAIHGARKVALHYRDEKEVESRRTVWPFQVAYRETTRLVVAWCETRDDFRMFRTDRVLTAQVLDDRYPARPAALRARWRTHLREQYGVKDH